MTRDPRSLYRIDIALHDEEDVAEWGATHAFLEMTPAWAGEGYTRAQLLAAHRWAAGVMTRAAVTLAHEINGENFLGLQAEAVRAPDLSACAIIEGHGLRDMAAHRYDGNDLITVGVFLPAWEGRVQEWFARGQQILNEIVAADSRPTPPETGALHDDVVLQETTRTNSEERTDDRRTQPEDLDG